MVTLNKLMCVGQFWLKFFALHRGRYRRILLLEQAAVIDCPQADPRPSRQDGNLRVHIAQQPVFDKSYAVCVS